MSKRIVIKKGTLDNPGEWQKLEAYPLPIITCPKCGLWNLGNSTHRIKPNGDVNASVICGHGCGFHDYVTLSDYKPDTRDE